MSSSYQWIVPPPILHGEELGQADEMKMNQLIRRQEGSQSFDVGLLGAPLSRSSISVSGACEAPQAIRLAWKYFSTYNIDWDIDLKSLRIVDIGDVKMHWTDIPLCHQHIQQGIVEALKHNPPFLPIIVGGDHSITCPLVQGIKEVHQGKTIGILQFDTHFDLRDLSTGGAANGTPIRGLIESGTVKGQHVVNIGLHGYYNSVSLKRYAEQHKVRYYTVREVRRRGITKVVQEAFRSLRDQVDFIYLTVDMDVLDMAFAPGVPASTPGGLSTCELFEAVYWLGKQQKVGAMDLVELDPTKDLANGITVKTGVHLILNFLCGYTQRKY
ncbi:formimidoylglutamase [Ammoniphilus sp. YIM 78166]|uniref:formimidoylglutamase n=1 Tax=Ammoniphilus sp. YIM 78166 TaxID=1644106 RepID=UPI00106F5DF4|nr:formimidoylglutamase [Ammoniphilus sp. YIM 78166]